MAAPSSLKAVVAALAGNTFVTAIKFGAFALSGSGAMLSEAIHSAADTGNQLLLFIGLRRGARPADDEFHYGYGGERFVFGILSAAGIFFIGCGVTVYHGIQSLLHPHPPHVNWVTFAVLGLSLLIEGGVLLFAVREVRRAADGAPFLRFVRERADPAAVAILLEDGAAVLGLGLATCGITLTWSTSLTVFDAAASILVGVLLGLVALYLVAANRALLLGRAVPDEVQERFVRILSAHPGIRSVHDVKTRQLTPEVYKFKAEISLDERAVCAALDGALPPSIAGAERARTLELLSRRALNFLCDEVDALERAVRTEIPQARHIDLEFDRAGEGDAVPAAGHRVR
ncbi:MAG: cation diffusion facilitator family transporter [Planctomycetes bacterium]|nr:cation diffusion facilitator family transporter [Planctomycetota bacterium]